MNSNEIQNRQNENKLLKIQYAARESYNAAEKANRWVWFLCLASAFSVFFPETWPVHFAYGISFFADLMAVCLMFHVSYTLKTGAHLRQYFDAYVLDICLNHFSEAELRKIKEVSSRIYLKNPINAEIQMKNTGHDYPPGVFEWYVFPNPCSGISAKFECQKQNTWWNSKMSHKRLIATICAAILLSIGFILLVVLHGEIYTIILCSAGLIIKIIERIIENMKYIKLSTQIDGAQQAIDSHPTEEGVERLQHFIDKRRSIMVLELNRVHKKNANELSKEYENIVS
jgi:hypothetical protein